MSLAIGAIVLAAPAVHADSDLALQLAQVLGSEKSCGLTYDQAAIEAFIKDRVPADDLQFTSQLNLFISGVQFNLQGMSQSQKTAHCTQIRRVAASFKFIKE